MKRSEKLARLRPPAPPPAAPPAQPRSSAKSATIEEVRAAVAELRAQADDAVRRVTDARWADTLDRAGVLPQYRDFARQNLGNVDPSTPDGRRAVDEWVASRPAMASAPAPAPAPTAPPKYRPAPNSPAGMMGTGKFEEFIGGLDVEK